ncbi:EAL domain-containing protein [Oenococcus oeni]|uniref:EAL domain-containing protein n=2 Tax=Oenococcus oeni TaxID=1247 RepID=UPI0008F88B1C|nr:EAL domain-containing protein [Oenococcus oeni]OIM25178.1 EAL domain-containing protein [Oenococcus oeni]
MRDDEQNLSEKVGNLYLVLQPIVNAVDCSGCEILDFEVLLREKSTNEFPLLTFQAIIDNDESNAIYMKWFENEIKKIYSFLPKKNLDINLDPQQLLLSSTWIFLKNISEFCHQIKIEITETPSKLLEGRKIINKQTLLRIKKFGYTVAFDDVDTGENNLQFVINNINYIDRIKLSLPFFRKESCREIWSLLKKWKAFADLHNLELIVEGVSNKKLSCELSKYKFNFQQGYYWSCPKRFYNFLERD